MRLGLAALLALAPAAPALAQVRAVAPVVPGAAASASAAAPSAIAASVPSLSASAVSAPLAAGASFSAPALSAAPALAPALPAASAPLPALPPSAIPPAAAPAAAPALPSAGAAALAPLTGSRAAVPANENAARAAKPVYHSLKDLARLLGQDPEASARSFDGAAPADGEPLLSDGARPSVPAGVRSVDVEPVRAPADVDRLIPRLQNSADMHDQLRARLGSMVPFDAYVYHDAKGGSFTGIDLSRRPENLDKMPELQAHEVATIRKIQAVTKDLQVLVREEGATPDLVVAGVVTEMKSVHGTDQVSVQLAHANHQLEAHARRHGLGLGTVVLDLVGRTAAEPARIESEIAKVVRESSPIGFSRVVVFAGESAQVYAPAADGAFRLSAETPFGPRRVPAAPAAPAAVLNFVPSALNVARLPDMDVVAREINEPSRLLQAQGIQATVTMYGSARIKSPEMARADFDAVVKDHGRRPKTPAGRRALAAAREALKMAKWYQVARDLGALVARSGGGKVAVVTGGGPGIMEAGNRGAFEAGGPSVGYNIKLPHEQGLNPYATPGLEFTFENFSTRKMALRHGAMGLVYFPGGFGTMDELFEVLTLMQTGKMPRTPIVLIGEKAYWDKILDFDEFDHMGLISHKDLSLFTYAETAEAAWAAIRAAHAPAARP